MANVWCEIILALLAACVGLAIVIVECLVIKEESEGTPGAFLLLHRIVAIKGVIQCLGGVILFVRVCRGGIKFAIACLVISSMNAFSIGVQVIMDGYGIYDINRQCQKYQEFCNAPGNSLQYAKVLLQSQEANFIIATTVNFIYVVILCRYLAAITSNLSTMNGSNSLDDAGEDKVLYSQVAN